MTIKRIKRIIGFVILPLSVITILLASYFRILDNYELETLDYRFHLRQKIPITDKLAIIEIGDDSIEKLGRFPFDRSYHAVLVKALSEAGAKAIVFDIFFSEPQQNDKELELALRSAKNVYLPFVFDIDTQKRSEVLSARGYVASTLKNFTLLAKGAGHINIVPDIDGKSRRVPIFIKYEGQYYPYISFLVSCDFLAIPQYRIKMVPGKCVILPNGTKIPLDEDSNMLINFSGKWGKAYRHYSYVDIINSYLIKALGQKPVVDLRVFKDKVCIVGLTATGTVDLRPSPFEPLYPGVGVHAEVFNSIMNRCFISRAPKEANLLMLAVLGLCLFFAILKTKPKKGLVILIGSIFIFLAAAVLAFNLLGVWIDVFLPTVVMIVLYLALTFYKYIAEWRRRLFLENELEVAKKIQESFLPKRLPAVETIDIAAAMHTARKVGGDLYDFIDIDPERVGVMVGDVSGKGIPASLFMAMVMAKFKFLASSEIPPQNVLFNLNSSLVKESSSNLFVTMFYMIFDLKEGIVRYANGGHVPVAYAGLSGNVEFLDVYEGAPLGLMDGPYSGKEMRFNKGDTYVLYTDGVTEAMNARSEMYGKERLAACIESHRDLSAKALLEEIERDVRRFEPPTKQHDDMMIIVIKIGSGEDKR
jgi:CHASE2 domain-containing sensor protein